MSMQSISRWWRKNRSWIIPASGTVIIELLVRFVFNLSVLGQLWVLCNDVLMHRLTFQAWVVLLFALTLVLLVREIRRQSRLVNSYVESELRKPDYLRYTQKKIGNVLYIWRWSERGDAILDI